MREKRKFFGKLMIITSLALILFVNISYGAVYTELAPLPGSTGTIEVGAGKGENLGEYLNDLYKIVVGSASVLAVLMIIIGGFSYVSSDAIGNKEDGKSQIKNALGGLMLVLASYIILNTVNPQLIKLNIVSKPLDSESLSVLTVLLLNQKSQEEINKLYQAGLLEDARAKNDARRMQNAARSAMTEIGVYNEIVGKYYEGTLTEEEKTKFFGTVDDAEIVNKIQDQTQNVITPATQKANTLIQEAEVIETLNRAEGVLVKGRRDLTENNVSGGSQERYNQWKERINEQINGWNVAITKLNSLDLADANFKNTKIAEYKEEVNANINAMCEKAGNSFAGQQTSAEITAACKASRLIP